MFVLKSQPEIYESMLNNLRSTQKGLLVWLFGPDVWIGDQEKDILLECSKDFSKLYEDLNLKYCGDY